MKNETYQFVTIAAILVGPISAVITTRIIDYYRDVRRRKLDMFKTLMRTRRNILNPDHVGALNGSVAKNYSGKSYVFDMVD